MSADLSAGKANDSFALLISCKPLLLLSGNRRALNDNLFTLRRQRAPFVVPDIHLGWRYVNGSVTLLRLSWEGSKLSSLLNFLGSRGIGRASLHLTGPVVCVNLRVSCFICLSHSSLPISTAQLTCLPFASVRPIQWSICRVDA
jgi:hypothetical protein